MCATIPVEFIHKNQCPLLINKIRKIKIILIIIIGVKSNMYNSV